MQQININDEQVSIPTKSSRNEKIFLVIVVIGFLYGAIFWLIFYALPKFLISKFLLKKENATSRIVRDTAISGLILGSLVYLGQMEIPSSSINNTSTPAQQMENISTSTKDNKITKNSADEEVIDNLYRNTKYNFRVKFPEGWDIKDGDGQHIVKKASNQDSSINIGVTDVSNFPEADSIHSITEMLTLDEFIKSTEEEYRPKYPNYKLIDSGETKIDNLPAYFVTADVEYSALNTTVRARITLYELFYNKRFYFFSLASEREKYEESKKVLETSLSTFVIEPS
jgi:hypothetical protein